jgi:hypothetical protein
MNNILLVSIRFRFPDHVIEAPAVNELVIECLVLTKGQCTREAWKAASEDNKFNFLEALGQSKVPSSPH